MVVNIREIPVIVEKRLVKKASVHILVRTCVSARKDGVNMMGTPKWIAPVVVVSEILFYLDIMETNTIVVIVLLSILGCGIIGVVIQFIYDKVIYKL
jgi:hypothetical protein